MSLRWAQRRCVFSLLITGTYTSFNEAVSKEIYFYLSYTKSMHTYPRICAYAMSGGQTRVQTGRPRRSMLHSRRQNVTQRRLCIWPTLAGRKNGARERGKDDKKTKRKKSDRHQVRSTFFHRRAVTFCRNATPTLLYQRCNRHTLCVATLLARAMSKRIRLDGISSMLELIWELSRAFVGEEHWKAGTSEFITERSRESRENTLLKISSPCISAVFSRAVCVPLATYTRSPYFFYWCPCTSVARKIRATQRGFFFSPPPMRDCNVDMIFMWYVMPHYITMFQFARKMI